MGWVDIEEGLGQGLALTSFWLPSILYCDAGDSRSASSFDRGPPGQLLQYPAVHACRPRIFFITLSSVKRQAILKLSLAATGRGSPPSPCGDDHSTRTSSAKLDTRTNTTAATDKAASPPPQNSWPSMLPPAAAAALPGDERTSDEAERATTGEDM